VTEVLGADFSRDLKSKKTSVSSMENVGEKLDDRGEVVDWTSEVNERCRL
jgi:hypothetical protein